jgi:competence protein ComEA
MASGGCYRISFFLEGDMTSWRSFFLGLCFGLLAAALILIGNGRMEGKPIVLNTPADPPGVRVSVQGAVSSPGVYNLPPGTIVQDALAAAGGTLPQADLARVNLAAVLVDGQELRIPVLVPTSAASTSGSPSNPAANSKINLNTATLAELDSLPGIGPVLAQRIIDYREQYGPFQSVDDLLKVKGIGSSLLEKIRNLVEAP